MSDNVKTLQRLRVALLKKVYEMSNGSTEEFVNSGNAAAELGIGEAEADQLRNAANYLEGEGLIGTIRVFGSFPGHLRLTHSGLKEIEKALSAPDRPTEHFMAINILNIGNVSGSNVQQGTAGGSQNLSIGAESIEQLKEFVSKLCQSIPQLQLNQNQKSELEAEVKSVQAQVESPKPKATIIREGLNSMRSILENAAGSALGSELAKQIPFLLALFG